MFGKRNLMIVAHPDDETIFGYSALMDGSSWHVMCMTNGNNSIRQSEFSNVMSHTDHSFEIFDFKDEWGGGFSAQEVSKLIVFRYHSENFHAVLTHNMFGEYGHTQHKALHCIVRDLKLNNSYQFGSSIKQLPFSLLKKKMEILTLYKSQYDLQAFDWFDSNDSSNRLMNYIVSEHFSII